jgi:hypothetical protein
LRLSPSLLDFFRPSGLNGGKGHDERRRYDRQSCQHSMMAVQPQTPDSEQPNLTAGSTNDFHC